MTQENKYIVINENGKTIGECNDWSEAKDIHKKEISCDLLPFYAGLDLNSIPFLPPVFSVDDIPDEIKVKHGLD